MTEADFRAAIVAEARSWIGTPYRRNGRIKGVGSNCAQFLFGVALGAKVLPADSPEPRWFTEQFAVHEKDERLADYIKAYGGREITESKVGPGDIVLYQTGLSHGHAAIVIDWPEVVHTMPLLGCQLGRAGDGILGAKSRRYFTLWLEAD